MNGFGQFWLAYPRHVGKLAAMRAFAIALRHASAADILAGVETYKRHLPDDPQYIPHAATFLNQGRWMDEYDEPVARPVWTPCAHTPSCPSKEWCMVLRNREKAS